MCEPRWATPRSPERESFGPAICAVAERLGQPLMPWQQRVAMVGGELDGETGLPAYREVVVTVPRQNGKTTLILSWEIQRALGWGRPQRIVYSAQTGNDARKKLIEDQVPLLEPRKSTLGIRSILRGMGNEAVVWRNGSRLVLLASSEDSGHGKSVDFAVKDELFADVDFRRDQALIPAMATRADAQVLTASTAGTDESLPLNRAVEIGRASVDSGARSGIAYFEWSAPESADIADPAVWRGCMPALGFTITEEVVSHALSTLTPSEFRRAFLNIGTRSDERVIPAEVWDLVCGADVAPVGRVSFGVEVSPEGASAAIVAATAGEIEVVEHRAGMGWVAARARELDSRWGRPMWACDGAKSAPVAAIVPDLRHNVARLELMSEMPAACGGFLAAVSDRAIRVRRSPVLDVAVAGASKRQVGDGWVWARRGTVDISPLGAATVALWVASRPVPTPSFVALDDFLEDAEV